MRLPDSLTCQGLGIAGACPVAAPVVGVHLPQPVVDVALAACGCQGLAHSNERLERGVEELRWDLRLDTGC